MSSPIPPNLLARAAAWIDGDPDPRTRAELSRLLSVATSGADGDDVPAALDELASRFRGPLEFGTAGLRGSLGAGPHRMNRAVVIRAAAGLARYLRESVVGQPRVVVGYDARHDSDVFARDTASVLTGAGCEALLLPRPLPTPVLAFAVRHLDADAGVMVTASHNPPRDNGYKVYLGGRVDRLGGGAQIVSPVDAHISARIAATPRAVDVPMPSTGWEVLDDGIEEEYLDAALGVLGGPPAASLRIVLTPLHGVGGRTAASALHRAGFGRPYLVPEQAAPDPDFPTVAFPNPEEPGALDLALAAAAAQGADLVVANDPDADRCAVAIPDPRTGHWRMLRGDELGCLLGEHVLRRRPPGGTVASSIVSSQLLGRIAAGYGGRHVETLTGFKWLARVPGLDYAYEEALGYCVAPSTVRDKDGITAALLAAELAATLKAAGSSLAEALDDQHRRFGVHVTDQLAVRTDDLARIARAMARLRQAPPLTLAGEAVVEFSDLARGEAGLPPTDGVRLRTAGGLRAVVRPSGTEPKVKCYLEAVTDAEGDLATARRQAQERLDGVRHDLLDATDLR